MRGGSPFALILPALAIFPALAFAQDFTGSWLLQESASKLGALPTPPASRMRVTLQAGRYTCAECAPGGWSFTTDRKSTETRTPQLRHSTAAKWEGDSLMLNIIAVPATGAQYVISDSWTLSRDGSRLTIQREIQRGGTSESTLLYLREGAPLTAATPVAATPPPATPPTPAQPPTQQANQQTPIPVVPAPTAPPPRQYTLESGARLPLRSLSAFSSKTAQPGDRVYLETIQTITRFGRILLPTGTQITATVAFVQGAGRVKGRGELVLRFESLTTPDGLTKDFRAQTTGADATAGRVDEEGRIRSGGNKAGDAGTVGATTAAGAVIGASMGRAGLGAAAGAAAGLARVLGSRGPDVNIARGDMLEMALDREVHFLETELR